MKFGDFKKLVTAYMRRAPGDFVGNGIDVLADAINGARMEAELTTDFELRKTSATLASLSLANGALLENLVDRYTSLPIQLKKIKRAYIDATNGGTMSVLFERYEIMQEKNKRRFDRVISNVALENDTLDGNWPVQNTVVQQGNRVFMLPATEKTFNGAPTIKLHFDVVRLGADYTNDADEDFLLIQGKQWMLMRCISQLNFFLKEDQRVALSAQAMDYAWQQLLRWNETYIAVEVEGAKLD